MKTIFLCKGIRLHKNTILIQWNIMVFEKIKKIMTAIRLPNLHPYFLSMSYDFSTYCAFSISYVNDYRVNKTLEATSHYKRLGI